MAGRANACTELTRWWLEARHGYSVAESLPVPVPYGTSDIDLIAVHPRGRSTTLPTGRTIGSRVIVECKDEHDFDPLGKDFGKWLLLDMAHINPAGYVPAGVKGIRFSMLRQQHMDVATGYFGSTDFDRVFVVHAIDAAALASCQPTLAAHRIHWISIRDVVGDLLEWYKQHPHPTELRHSPVGDLVHLLVGFCGLTLPPQGSNW